MRKTIDKKQRVVYFTIFAILFALVILPIVAVFSEAVITDGRFDLCAKHGTNLAGESPATGFYRQV
ncbi:hypothetical protein [Enterocloster sp.]|uniref:hypothetical protein n=1 Tax=Enterocloster sp. TaxID=2719315 RepID=UPI003991CB04